MRRWSAAIAVAVALAVGLSAATAWAAPSYSVVARWPKPTWHMGPRPTALSTLVPTASTYGAGIDVAMTADGTTFVCDTYNSQVLKFDPNGDLVATWTGAGNPGGQFKKPQGIDVSSNGAVVYIADTGNSRVQKYSGSGVYLDHWGVQGGPSLADDGRYEFMLPEGIAVDQAGDVYVADTGNCRVQKYDSSGMYLDQWGSPGTGPSLFYAPSSIAIAPDGTNWVLDRSGGMGDTENCYVQHFNASGEHLGMFGGYTNLYAPGKFRFPGGISVDGEGYIWVADNDILGPRLQRFQANTSGSADLVLNQQGRYHWNNFTDDGAMAAQKFGGVATFTKNGAVRVRVADQGKSMLRDFDDYGETVGYNASWGKGKSWMANPGGVAVGPTGKVYVADTDNHRVQTFGSQGTFEQWLPSMLPPMALPNLGHFDTPQGVAVAEDGDVFVIEEGKDETYSSGRPLGTAGNHRVQKLSPDLGSGDPDAASVYVWGAWGTGSVRFRNPQAIAARTIDANTDRIYVADSGNNRIEIFTLTHGTPSLTQVGSWTMPSLSSNPSGIAVAPDGSPNAGSVYVADTAHNKIVRFSSGGTVLGSWGSMGTLPGQFKSPRGLACDAAGNVYVADTDNNRIQVFTPDGTFASQFGKKGSLEGELYLPRSVAVSAEGLVYVADSGNDRIQAFAPPVSVTIGGVEDGAYYNHGVTPVVSFIGPQIVESSKKVALNGVPWVPVTLTAEGDYTVEASATSSLGTSDSDVVHFGIDTTKPITTMDGVGSYDDTATIAFQATDARSGVRETKWRLDGGSIFTGSTAVITKAGVHTIEYWSIDKAGNEEVHQTHDFEVVDTMPPVTTSDAKPTYVTSATIRLSATDGSGVKQTLYRLDGGAETSGTIVAVAGYGSHTLEFWSIDTSGRTEAKQTVTFNIVRKTTTSLSRSTAVVSYNGIVTLRGSLRNDRGVLLRGKTVRLMRSSDGRTWSVYRLLTSSTGLYSTSVRLPRCTYFKLDYPGSTTWAAASSPAVRVLARAYLTTPIAVSSVRRGASFKAVGYLKPRHEAGTGAVKLYCYRYERGSWVLRKTVTLYASDYSGYTRYSGTLSLPSAGSWRMRAYHGDSSHTATYSGYRSISVK